MVNRTGYIYNRKTVDGTVDKKELWLHLPTSHLPFSRQKFTEKKNICKRTDILEIVFNTDWDISLRFNSNRQIVLWICPCMNLSTTDPQSESLRAGRWRKLEVHSIWGIRVQWYCFSFRIQGGFFRGQPAFLAENNNARVENNNQEGQNEAAPPPVQPAPRIPSATPDGHVDAARTNMNEENERPGAWAFTWTFFSSFFASLIPDQPNVI